MRDSRLDLIELRDVVPAPLADERTSGEVWRTELTLHRGTFYRIDAASGAGKSSLCAFLMGTRVDYKGHILYNNKDISAFGVREWCRLRERHLAYLPQELGLFDSLTAMQNVLLKNALTDYHSEAEIRTMFGQLGIDTRADRLVGTLSVGQKQRVALIRSLCQPFDFLILDEPVSHLDAESNLRCAEMVTAEARGREAGVITTSVGNPLSLADVEILKL
ncbi:MAG: ATP-binding cassette domain-containing protein [Muribaculaceae bacterium]|nr:ATP-binding cassette domain-containing protein [Muribaculaceae bacterium]